MANLSKYNPKYHDDWAWSLAIKGGTNDEIAQAFGISTRTFIRWRREHESLETAVTEGKDIADAKVEKSLYQRATGYQITDEERTIEMDPRTGEQRPARVKKTIKNVVPDTMAIMYWLNNRRRAQWSQRQEVALSAGDDAEDVLIYLPANGRDPDEQTGE